VGHRLLRDRRHKNILGKLLWRKALTKGGEGIE
jgi:hypothetical protein